MTMIHTSTGAVPFHAIDFVSDPVETSSRGSEVVLHLRSGETRRAAEWQWTNQATTPVQIMPAAPGWSFIRAYTGGDDPAEWVVMRTPVIGWALCVDGNVRPVAPAGVDDGLSSPELDTYVEAPCGLIEATNTWAEVCRFESEADFFDHFLALEGKSRAAISEEPTA